MAQEVAKKKNLIFALLFSHKIYCCFKGSDSLLFKATKAAGTILYEMCPMLKPRTNTERTLSAK